MVVLNGSLSRRLVLSVLQWLQLADVYSCSDFRVDVLLVILPKAKILCFLVICDLSLEFDQPLY